MEHATLMKRNLDNAHAKATSLNKAWTIIEFLENEADSRRGFRRKSVCASRAFNWNGVYQDPNPTTSPHSKSDEAHMQYHDALEGSRSQGFLIAKVAVRRYEIMQRFNGGVLNNFELKKNLALVYAKELYVEESPTV